jgi:hypothetical protein
METLNVQKENAIKAYGEATKNGKTLLENLFGKKVFIGNIIERCTTVEDACKELGINYATLYDGCADDYERSEKNIKTFAKAMRQDKDESECFYYPYFYGSGGGFSYYDYAYAPTHTSVGARLRVWNSEQAVHMGKCLIEDYKIYLDRK